ncbi:MAG: ABC transporter ATP-binding protein [Syntrophales bacterium]|jgi:peptide/nickel transport system ATP-binding protein/oligopeptide transport system ATP-binding protein|nr:ABC transporter ATP-binding protein [Syntrophales bacterium]
MRDVLMEIRGLSKTFHVSGGWTRRGAREVRAVRDVTLSIRAGETLGLVGESGCGKSTLGRLCLALEKPTSGEVRFEGRNIFTLTKPKRKAFRRAVQLVFQDPYASLNPRRTAGQTVMEPLLLHATDPRLVPENTRSIMRTVGLSEEQAQRYPHEFSGGQRQRIGIARAIALKPKLIVADEPVSALDVSIQAQILNLMKQLQRDFGLTYLFITHDFSVVRYMSDRIAVMYLGRIVELASNKAIFANPLHPYTRLLHRAIPVPDPRAKRPGQPAEIDDHPPSEEGCLFYPRCPERLDRCREWHPTLFEPEADHRVACIRKKGSL